MAASWSCQPRVGTYLQTDGRRHQLEWETMQSPWTYIVYFYTAKSGCEQHRITVPPKGFGISGLAGTRMSEVILVNQLLCACKYTKGLAQVCPASKERNCPSFWFIPINSYAFIKRPHHKAFTSTGLKKDTVTSYIARDAEIFPSIFSSILLCIVLLCTTILLCIYKIEILYAEWRQFWSVQRARGPNAMYSRATQWMSG